MIDGSPDGRANVGPLSGQARRLVRGQEVGEQFDLADDAGEVALLPFAERSGKPDSAVLWIVPASQAASDTSAPSTYSASLLRSYVTTAWCQPSASGVS